MSENLIREIDGIEFEAGEVSPVISYFLSKDGIRTSPISKFKAKSFLKGFVQLLAVRMGQVYNTPMGGNFLGNRVRDTAGYERYPAFNPWTLVVTAALGVVDRGILVGQGVTPVTFEDFEMESQIAHGAGFNQLEYSLQTYGLPASDAVAAHFRISRVFGNDSLALINVTEVGVYAGAYPQSNVSTNDFRVMIIRDLFPPGGVDIPNGQQLTINYDIRAVV